jgi:lipoyl-dependent peroxiredoxin subunit D
MSGAASDSPTLPALRDSLPDAAKDIKLNLAAVLQPGVLSPEQRWGVAVTSAITARNPALRDAILAEARAAGVAAPVLDDAQAAAALMAMNNVYYRFRHFMEKPSYADKPARLRMNRIARPATNKADFELYSLAASAINGCEMCVRSHEDAVIKGGLTEDHVHDAVRIAATIHAAAVSLEMGPTPLSAAAAA